MDPNVFRKEDAPSILVIEKPWKDVFDKPNQFDEVAKRVIDMMKAAIEAYNSGGLLTRPDTLRRLRDIVNSVIITPLTTEYKEEHSEPAKDPDSIFVDAFWEEIPGIPPELTEALKRLLKMKEKIDDNVGNKLDNKSTLMDAKELVNETVLEPLNGIDYDY